MTIDRLFCNAPRASPDRTAPRWDSPNQRVRPRAVRNLSETLNICSASESVRILRFPLLTQAFKGWVVPCNCGKVVPDPLQHVFTLLYAREWWRFNVRLCLYFVFGHCDERPHVPFWSLSTNLFAKILISLPERISKTSPNLISVPCAAATALSCFRVMEPVWKGSYGTLFA